MPTYILETDKPISECDDCPCRDEGYYCAAADLKALDFDTDEGFGSRPEWCPLVETDSVEPCFVEKALSGCDGCPIGKYDVNSYGERKGLCRWSDNDNEWCPLKPYFLGKSVVYLVSKDYWDDALNPSGLMAFTSFDDAKDYVESKTVEAVCLNRQRSHWRPDGKARRPDRFWTVEDSGLFDEMPELEGDSFFDDFALEEYVDGEFDPAFAKGIEDGKSHYDIMMENRSSDCVRLFSNYGMTRWYHKDEIIDRKVAHYHIEEQPYTSDGPDFGKAISWSGSYIVNDEWYDDARSVCEVGHEWVIRMVEAK